MNDLFLIVGSGNMGFLWAHKLTLAGHHLAIFDHKSQFQSQRSVSWRGLFEGSQTYPSLRLEGLETLSKHTQIHILLCCKSTQSVQALAPFEHKAIASRIRSITCIQNGLGQHQALAKMAFNADIYACYTTGACNRQGNNFHYVAAGENYFGLFKEPATHARPAFITDANSHPHIHTLLAKKLAINALINPLSVVHRCKNSELLTLDAAQKDMHALATEVDAAFKAEGFDIDSLKAAQAVCASTSENYSSMYQDVYVSGTAQVQTEVDYINGFILSLAKQHNVPAKHNAALYQQIKALHTNN